MFSSKYCTLWSLRLHDLQFISFEICHFQFVERRRAALERYMNRTAAHPSLKADPDFREFLELDADLPKSSQVTTWSSSATLPIKFLHLNF